MTHRTIILIALVLLVSTPCFAHQIIVVFGNDSKPPKSWTDKCQPRGISVDILREIEKRTDLKFYIHLFPWKRAYNNAKERRGAIFGLSKTSERQKIFDYSDVMYFDEMRLITLKGQEFPFTSCADLKGKTIGVTRGALYGDEYAKALGTIFTPSYDANPVVRLRMLLAGRIDAALVGPGKSCLKHIINQDPKLKANADKFTFLPHPFARDPNYLGFHKKLLQKPTIAIINQALHEMWKDGTITAIEARY